MIRQTRHSFPPTLYELVDGERVDRTKARQMNTSAVEQERIPIFCSRLIPTEQIVGSQCHEAQFDSPTSQIPLTF
jgi:hypothetical protein